MDIQERLLGAKKKIDAYKVLFRLSFWLSPDESDACGVGIREISSSMRELHWECTGRSMHAGGDEDISKSIRNVYSLAQSRRSIWDAGERSYRPEKILTNVMFKKARDARMVGRIYLVENKHGYVKIGHFLSQKTKRVEHMLKLHDGSEFICSIGGGQLAEQAIHSCFYRYRLEPRVDLDTKEWFAPAPDLIPYFEDCINGNMNANHFPPERFEQTKKELFDVIGL